MSTILLRIILFRAPRNILYILCFTCANFCVRAIDIEHREDKGMTTDERMERLFSMLGAPLKDALLAMDAARFGGVEQIRVRARRPVQVVCADAQPFLCADGSVRESPEGALFLSEADCGRMMERLTGHSLYAFEEEMKNGYLTLPGGHRVGFCGRAVMDKSRLKFISPITALHIRIAREHIGAADKIMDAILTDGGMRSVLILSPPGCGKTTMLRDAARQLSHGLDAKRHMVAIADERGEIAGCFQGVPQVDVGPCTDVLDGCPKAEALPLLLRVMTPDVLVCDEIGRLEEAEALFDAIHAGVKVLASAHASSLEQARKRPALSLLLSGGVFELVAVLGRSKGVGTLEALHLLGAEEVIN